MNVSALDREPGGSRAWRAAFLMVGTGVLVSTGVVDPLPDSPPCAARNKLWFNVDGAMEGSPL